MYLSFLLAVLGVLGGLAVPFPLVSSPSAPHHFGLVTAPSAAEETDAAYLAKTPVV